MASLQLTTIARVKTVLSKNDSADDQFLTSLVAEVSTKIEQFVGRAMLQAERTEVYDGEPRMNRLTLFNAPVSAISSIKTRASITTDWSNVTAIDTDNDELQEADGRSGVLLLNFQPYVGLSTIQAVYTAGFGADTSDLLANYPDIAAAAERQVAYEFDRRRQVDGATIQIQGAQEGSIPETQLLRAVKETLWAYRAWGMLV